MHLPVVLSLGQVSRQSLSHPVRGPLHAASQLNGLVKGPVDVFSLQGRANLSKLVQQMQNDQSGRQQVKTSPFSLSV